MTWTPEAFTTAQEDGTVTMYTVVVETETAGSHERAAQSVEETRLVRSQGTSVGILYRGSSFAACYLATLFSN